MGALLAVLAAVTVAVLVVLRASPPAAPAPNPSGNPSGTATVQRRNLVQTDTESGTIGYENPRTVYNRLSGTITWLPRVGQVIKPGQTLFAIVGEPVTLMDGAAPAYRVLSASDSPGADVGQLNRNLVRLGFDPDGIVVDDEWQPATTVGVELLQESLGEAETGSLSLGQIVFLRGPRVITALDGTVGSAGGGAGSAGGGGSSQSTSASPEDRGVEFVGLEHATSRHDLTPPSRFKRPRCVGCLPRRSRRRDGPDLDDARFEHHRRHDDQLNNVGHHAVPGLDAAVSIAQVDTEQSGQRRRAVEADGAAKGRGGAAEGCDSRAESSQAITELGLAWREPRFIPEFGEVGRGRRGSRDSDP
ncbi:MAG: hypothetical protein ACRDL5_04955 [Solirubrobacteraceae bacterium]